MGFITGSRQRTFRKEGAPVDGDFNGHAETGTLVSDVTNGVLYINTGTLTETTWTVVGGGE